MKNFALLSTRGESGDLRYEVGSGDRFGRIS